MTQSLLTDRFPRVKVDGSDATLVSTQLVQNLAAFNFPNRDGTIAAARGDSGTIVGL